jgi:hypothetical protein
VIGGCRDFVRTVPKAQAEQRAAELAIVNGVLTGLAAQLEMQAIYDLVGETIRETFGVAARGPGPGS